MFEDLQRLFRESVAAFREERDRREPEDEVAHLLGSMRRELVETRALIPKLEEMLASARTALQKERDELERTERRGKLALDINDGETVRIAQEFAVRHEERIVVLEKKVSAAEAELTLRTRESEEMKRHYQEADANRMELVARLRRGQSRERIRSVAEEAAESFSEWDRMADKMAGNSAYVDALLDLEEEAPRNDHAEVEVEDRLRELKRRMGR